MPTSTGRTLLAGAGLWLRWSGRDLRARWLQVAAIALVIGLGTGSYAGLSSVTEWRRASTDSAYELLNMYDLRVELAAGGRTEQGALLALVSALPDPAVVQRAEERLVFDVQVDASTPGGPAVLVPGTIYGVDVGDGGPHVNGFSVSQGRTFAPADAGSDNTLLEANFARFHELPPEGDLLVSGGRRLHYVGHALTPEYFIVTTDRGGLLAEASFAAIFAPLDTAQSLAGSPGVVNDLLLDLAPGADRDAVARDLAAIAEASPGGPGLTITTRDEDPSFRLNDRDIDGDQQIYDIFAGLIFAGAVVASFNLIARIVESQRREIGIAMALGVRPRVIAVRPMLIAAEIAFTGVLAGVAVGLLIGQAMASVLRDYQPLPTWQTSFRPLVFAQVAVIGFVLPFLATLWPVWRAVRVPPIDAVKPAYRSYRTSGLAPVLSRLALPGSTFAQLPVRNLVRAPRRTLLTSIGVAAAIAALVSFVGLIDSFLATVGRGDAVLLSSNPERVDVTLDRFYALDSPEVAAVTNAATVATAVPGARVAAEASTDRGTISLQLELIPLDNPIWAPPVSPAPDPGAVAGIYLSEIAARDLGVEVGDDVRVRHPRLTGDGSVILVDDVLPVLGTHPHPFRFIAYMDSSASTLLGITGLANFLQVLPVDGASQDDVKRELFVLSGVSSTEAVGEVARAIEDLLEEFVVLLRIIEGAMLLLALLIAFNSASINMDERAREHATMAAFGVPNRTVLRMAVIEGALLGLLATVGGIVGGWFLLRAIIAIRIPETLPDIDVQPDLANATLAIALALGIGAVALAPLLTARRLRRMDIPSTLKVAE